MLDCPSGAQNIDHIIALVCSYSLFHTPPPTAPPFVVTPMMCALCQVGWGEETAADGTVTPYWIGRNSWGTYW